MLPSPRAHALDTRAGVRLIASGPGGLMAAADLEGGLAMYADRRLIWRNPTADLDDKTRHAARVTDMAFDRFGEHLLVAGTHGVASFDALSGRTDWMRRRRWVFGFLPDLPLSLCRGPESDIIVSWSSGRVERLDNEGNKKRRWFDNAAPASMAYIEGDVRHLVGADGYSLRSWDASVWPPVERASVIGRWVKVMAVPSTGRFLARRLDATLLLNAADLSVVWEAVGPVSHPSIAVFSDRKTVAWLDDHGVSLRDAVDGKQIRRVTFGARALCVAASDNGFVVGLADGMIDHFAP